VAGLAEGEEAVTGRRDYLLHYASTGEARRAASGMRRLRMERGLDYRAAAELLGVDASVLCRAEHGARTPPPVSRIAEAFGVAEYEVFRLCPHCGYDPPPGYMCLRCGMPKEAMLLC
jgi:hypothetical protein